MDDFPIMEGGFEDEIPDPYLGYGGKLQTYPSLLPSDSQVANISGPLWQNSDDPVPTTSTNPYGVEYDAEFSAIVEVGVTEVNEFNIIAEVLDF
jgi:hypothetical protein